MPAQPASTTNGKTLAESLRRQYGRRLLDQLPFVPPGACCTGELIAGYRHVAARMVRTARRVHGIDANLITTRSLLERDARAARAVFEVVHRHLIACEFLALVARHAAHDHIELVLLAEQQVAELAGDIGDEP
jgi:hypothetical protein